MAVEGVRVAAHAKVNLLLRILAPERGGMHQIETVFALLALADELIVRRTAGTGIALQVHGPDLGPVDDNLAVRAARAVLDATGNRFGVAIELTKRIPVRAGLGGGSSDAAAVLHAVNALADGAVPQPELLHFAARLGADVAFFASGAPLALAWGRGERLFRLPPLSAAAALVAVPPDAFAVRTVLDAPAFAGWGSVGRLGGNDFEAVVFARHPPIRALFERLAGTHPYWVRLCGSGSAVAAVYASERLREDAALLLGEKHQTLFRTATRSVAAPPPEAY
jgi:4-diphosphocytidyl-2-C-methyl-D-erythritol kinase